MVNAKVVQLEQVMIQLIKYALNALQVLFSILQLLNAKIIKLLQIQLVHKEPAMIQSLKDVYVLLMLHMIMELSV